VVAGFGAAQNAYATMTYDLPSPQTNTTHLQITCDTGTLLCWYDGDNLGGPMGADLCTVPYYPGGGPDTVKRIFVETTAANMYGCANGLEAERLDPNYVSESPVYTFTGPTPPGLLPLPTDFISASLASTSQLVTDFEVPLAFIIGALVLFIIVPKVISWFKQISDRGRYTSK